MFSLISHISFDLATLLWHFQIRHQNDDKVRNLSLTSILSWDQQLQQSSNCILRYSNMPSTNHQMALNIHLQLLIPSTDALSTLSCVENYLICHNLDRVKMLRNKVLLEEVYLHLCINLWLQVPKSTLQLSNMLIGQVSHGPYLDCDQ